jgi:aspartate aminotransferase, cytoplasmic
MRLNFLLTPPPAAPPGTFDRAIVLLHGLTSAHQTFLNVLQPLAAASELPILAIDLRGHGRSPEPEDPLEYGLSEMAADVVETADACEELSPGAKLIVLGHSWGSRVALQLGSDHTDRVLAVVVEDEFVRGDAEKKGPALSKEVLAERVAELRSTFQPEHATREALIAWFETSVGEPSRFGLADYANKVGKRDGDNGQEVWFPLFKPHADLVWDEYCRLADMNVVWKDTESCPFLIHVMAGGGKKSGSDVSDEDFEELRSQAAAMSGGLRTVNRIEGAGHVVHRTHPDEFLASFKQYVLKPLSPRQNQPSTDDVEALAQFRGGDAVVNEAARRLFAGVELAPPDPIFGLNTAFRADTSEKKVNLGVGAYRTAEGKPWVLSCVQKAEERILEQQVRGEVNKEYLPIDGKPELRTHSANLIFGTNLLGKLGDRCQNIQCISGTGALRVGFEYVARFVGDSGKKPLVLLPDPTWANHHKIISHAGLQAQNYRYLDRGANQLDLDGLLADLAAAPDGSIVVLHACAHNPTGVDPTPTSWEKIANTMRAKGHLAFFDTAYQGFASGDLERDAWAVRHFVQSNIPMFVAQSYSKNFGLYGERVGCLQIVTGEAGEAKAVHSQMKGIARGMYSNPPIHGALIVATVLGDETLTKLWHEELSTMAARIGEMRTQLRDALLARKVPGNWDHITSQIGMFSYTGLNKEQVQFIIENHHIYFTGDGRISMPGLNSTTIEFLADAIADCIKSCPA